MNEDRLRFDLAELADEVSPVDLRDRALRTSRRLGIQRAVTTSAAVLVLIAAATGTALAVRPGEQSRPAPAGPSMTATPTPTPTPAATSPSPSAEPTGAAMAPVTADEARNASIRVGKWNTDICPAGTYRFNDGNSVYKPAQDSPRAFSILGDPVIADVDRDGDLDAVVLITCSPFAVQAQQVIALHRTASGAVATLGQVAVTGAQPGGGEITQVAATSDGAVRVKWTDTQLMDDNAATQWRVYRWTGNRFRQSDGPTSFPKVSLDLKVVAGQASLVKQPDNSYEGDLVVTVTNTGNVAADHPGIHLTLPASVSLTKVRGVVNNVAYVHDSGPPKVMLCQLSAIPAGKSLTITFSLRFTGSGQPAAGVVDVFSNQVEKSQSNNRAQYVLTTTGS